MEVLAHASQNRCLKERKNEGLKGVEENEEETCMASRQQVVPK
jgi:hypothetical protein